MFKVSMQELLRMVEIIPAALNHLYMIAYKSMRTHLLYFIAYSHYSDSLAQYR